MLLVFYNVPLLASERTAEITVGNPIGIAPDTLNIPVVLSTNRDISGLALKINFATPDIQLVGISDHVEPFEGFSEEQEGQIKIVLLNTKSSDALVAGTHQLFLLSFAVSATAPLGKYKLDIEDISLIEGNGSGDEFKAKVIEGDITVTDQVLKIEYQQISNSDLRLAFSLRSNTPVAALDVRVKWDAGLLSFLGIDKNSAIESLDLFYSTSDQHLDIILVDLELEHSQAWSHSNILVAEFQQLLESDALDVLVIDKVIVSDPTGNEVRVAVSKTVIEGAEHAASDSMTEAEGERHPSGASPDSSQVEEEIPDQTTRNEMLQHQRSVRIVEILADPPNGIGGDANGDGIRDSRADEFVEIENAGESTVSVGNWLLGDDDVDIAGFFEFPSLTNLNPGQRAVVFGGGNPVNFSGIVFNDDGSIGNGLTNSGDKVLLLNAYGDTIDFVEYGSEGGKDQSMILSDGNWVLHEEGVYGAAYSPGEPAIKDTPASASGTDDNAQNGVAEDSESDDETGGTSDTGEVTEENPTEENPTEENPTEENPTDKAANEEVTDSNGNNNPNSDQVVGEVSGSAKYTIRIVEILADPPTGMSGDANGDGIRNSREDEFVELVNVGASEVDLSGWRIGDDDVSINSMYVFPMGVVLSPRERLVVFGGGVPTNIPGKVFVGDGSIGNGLTNSGDVVLLVDANGDTIDIVSFGPEAGQDQSIFLNGSHWQLHKNEDGRIPFSPNAVRPTVDVGFVLPRFRSLQVGEKTSVGSYVYYTDGVDAPITDGDLLWASSDTSIVGFDNQGVLHAKARGKVSVWFVWKGKESLHGEIQVVETVIGENEIDLKPYGNIQLSEILADPGDLDANGDGMSETFSDEFIELYNSDNEILDLSGWYLGDGRYYNGFFRFPDSTLFYPNQYLTLFGGGTANGIPGVVFVDDGRISDGLSNSGDEIRLIAPNGTNVVLSKAFRQSPKGASLVPVGEGFEAHDSFPRFGKLSPGRGADFVIELSISLIDPEIVLGDTIVFKATGTLDNGLKVDLTNSVLWFVNGEKKEGKNGSFALQDTGFFEFYATKGEFWSNKIRVEVISVITQDRDPGETPQDMEPIVLEDNQTNIETVINGLILTEIHANPASGILGDTNGNGKRETYGDEFIEFMNVSPDTLNLSGWLIGDDDIQKDQYLITPQETLIAPQSYLVVWGLAEPLLDHRLSAGGRIGDGLSNGGDRIRVYPPNDSTTVLEWAFPPSSPGISLVPEGHQNSWIAHNEAPSVEQLSPATGRVLVKKIEIWKSADTVLVGEKIDIGVSGFYSDGDSISITKDIEWVSSDTIIAFEKSRVRALSNGVVRLVAKWGGLVAKPVEFVVVDTVEITLSDSVGENFEDQDLSPTLRQGNSAPIFENFPDTIAWAGLQYLYIPSITDSDGETTTVVVLESPGWLAFDGTFLRGTVPDTQGMFSLKLIALDGVDSTLLSVDIHVQNLELLKKVTTNRSLFLDVSYEFPLSLGDLYDVQIDGNLEWEHRGEVLKIKPTKSGWQRLGVSISKDGAQTIKWWEIHVDIRPNLFLEMVGEYRVDIGPDIENSNWNFLIYMNKGQSPLDLSGFEVRRGKKAQTYIEKVVLGPNKRLLICSQFNEMRTYAEILLAPDLFLSPFIAGEQISIVAPQGITPIDATIIPNQIPGTVTIRDSTDHWVQVDLSEGFEQSLGVVPSDVRDAPVSTEHFETNRSTDRMTLYPQPNPFNTFTEFGFYSTGGFVGVTVYSVLGQPVRTLVSGYLSAGYYLDVWDGTNNWGEPVSTGIYFIHFDSEKNDYTHKVALLK